MANASCRQGKRLYISVLVAFVFWFVIFVIRPFGFWLMLCLATSTLSIFSFAWGRPLFQEQELRRKNVALGILSAAFLYAVFWLGNQGLALISRILPTLLPDPSSQVEAVYANRGDLPPLIVGGLLFFPIGFGEELFWRGYVQKQFSKKWDATRGFAVTTLLYTAIHIPTGNPVLILAALTCGIFWGGLYRLTGSLVAVLVSHMLWDPAILVLWPIK